MKFMDVHHGMKGITPEALQNEHGKDKAIEGRYGVHFEKTWADAKSGNVFCLSEGPDAESVRKVHEEAGHPAQELYEISCTVG